MATTEKISFDLASDVCQDLDAIADEQGVSRAAVLRWAVRDYIFLRRNTLESKKL